MLPETDIKKDKLNVLFTDVLFVETYIKMLDEFYKHFVKDYDEDSV